jgi:hypothetical protein
MRKGLSQEHILLIPDPLRVASPVFYCSDTNQNEAGKFPVTAAWKHGRRAGALLSET